MMKLNAFQMLHNGIRGTFMKIRGNIKMSKI